MGITLDEAIENAKEKAKEQQSKYDKCLTRLRYNCEMCFHKSKCNEIANENKQLAEWLEELKDYRDKNKMVVRVDCENMDSIKDKIEELSRYAENQYNKAIDDLMKKVSECFISNADWNYLVQEAEQLKEGGKDEQKRQNN